MKWSDTGERTSVGDRDVMRSLAYAHLMKCGGVLHVSASTDQ